MQGVTANLWVTQEYETVLVAGMPKLGKTTLATSGPLPMVVIACDLGKLSICPGQDRSQILVLPYQDLTREMGDLGTSSPKRDVYTKLMRDLAEIARSIKNGEPLKLEDGTEFPTPQTVVLDGFSRLNNMLVDGKLSLNGKQYVEDLDKQARFNFWGKRLTDVYTTLQQFASFKKCHLVITSWVKAQIGKDNEPTGAIIPDIGGAMDIKTAGVVANTLLVESRGGKYFVRTKPDAKYPWLGLRDNYTAGAEIDITVDPTKPGTPWEKVFPKREVK